MGKIKQYTITLDEDLVDSVKIALQSTGGKLSTLINSLLQRWFSKQFKERAELPDGSKFVVDNSIGDSTAGYAITQKLNKEKKPKKK